jgi:hypothetical protein
MADFDMEPTTADLAAIEAEWPVIEAELAVLDAQISALVAPSPLDTRRIRRARHRLLATLAQHPARPVEFPRAGAA